MYIYMYIILYVYIYIYIYIYIQGYLASTPCCEQIRAARSSASSGCILALPALICIYKYVHNVTYIYIYTCMYIYI